MLIQFSVENFRSFKEKAVLSMEASADKMHTENFVINGQNKILKVATIFGANAAGKSNIFLALTAAILEVRFSNKRQVGEPLINMVPFKFDKTTVDEPSKFEFVFIAKDNKKYVYGFEATQNKIYKEYLYVYNSSRATTIFERDEEREEVYKFTNAGLKRELFPLTHRNTENKLFISTATEWNCEVTRPAYEFFAFGINTRTSNYQNAIPVIAPLFEADTDNSLKNFTKELLKEADISIEDFDFSIEEKPLEQILADAPPEIRSLIQQQPRTINKEFKVYTLHQIEKNGKKERYEMSIADESEGTKCLFAISPALKNAFKTGEAVCIDEMDKSLHPSLIQHLINLFNNPEINTGNAQLITSTHTTTLLSQEYLRRDQFYFVDKDRKTGESELYSLDEFSPRKREDIRKAYLLGRYGAMPNIREGGYVGI